MTSFTPPIHTHTPQMSYLASQNSHVLSQMYRGLGVMVGGRDGRLTVAYFSSWVGSTTKAVDLSPKKTFFRNYPPPQMVCTKPDLNMLVETRVLAALIQGRLSTTPIPPTRVCPLVGVLKNGRSQAGYAMHVDCGHNGPLDEAGPAFVEGAGTRLGADGWRWLEWLMMSTVTFWFRGFTKHGETD